MTIRYPMMTGTIVAGIYYQALKLWWKQCAFYTHPKKQRASVPRLPSEIQRPPADTPLLK